MSDPNPQYYSGDFTKDSVKHEFNIPHVPDQCLLDHQSFLRNVVSLNTVYTNLLLFHDVGTGKTLSAIAIAEGMKEYVANLGRKIIVIVKNKNIQAAFVNELVNGCFKKDYTEGGAEGGAVPKTSKELIKDHYTFITYRTFIDRTIGSRVYNTDPTTGKNTPKVDSNGAVMRKKVGANSKITDFSNTVVIVDEIHNATGNDLYTAIHSVAQNSFNYRLLLLTATPVYDSVTEIFELSNLLNANDATLQLPIRKDAIRAKLVHKVNNTRDESRLRPLRQGVYKVTEKGIAALVSSLRNKVSFVPASSSMYPVLSFDEGLSPRNPTLQHLTGKYNIVQMSQHQTNGYIKTLSTTDLLFKRASESSVIVYPDSSVSKEGFTKYFTRSAAAVHVPVSREIGKYFIGENLAKYSAKIHSIIQKCKASKGLCFVYSEYVSNGGTDLLAALFALNGFGYGFGDADEGRPRFVMYTEATTPESRERIRKKFNSPANKYGSLAKVIIGSPIISEGITLKNVRDIFILEPQWNKSRTNQIIGRGYRSFSHHDLPLDQRTLTVHLYAAVPSEPSNSDGAQAPRRDTPSIDVAKCVLSEMKDVESNFVTQVIKEYSIDCDRACALDDNQCKVLKCKTQSIDSQSREPRQVDYSTYFRWKQDFSKDVTNYIKMAIANAFKVSVVYTESNIVKIIVKANPSILSQDVITTLDSMVETQESIQE